MSRIIKINKTTVLRLEDFIGRFKQMPDTYDGVINTALDFYKKMHTPPFKLRIMCTEAGIVNEDGTYLEFSEEPGEDGGEVIEG